MSTTISTNNLSNGVTLTNTADSPVYIAPGVTIANPAGPGLVNAVAYYWSVTNGPNAQINGSQFGVALNGADTVSNRGTISASYSAGGGFSYDSTTHVLGIMHAGVYVGGGGVSNGASGVISGVIGVGLQGPGSVVNAGVIEDPVAGKGFAVGLASGGSVTNLSGGAISGGNYGVLTDGIASVTNQSTAKITGTSYGIFMINGSGSVGNQGSIGGGINGLEMESGGTVSNVTGGAISGGDYGIQLGDGGVVGNTTGGVIGGADSGVRIQGAQGSVTNQGGIVGTSFAGVYMNDGGGISNQSGGMISSDRYGVLIKGGQGIITNQGTLLGTTRVGAILTDGGAISNQPTGAIVGGYAGIVVEQTLASVMNQGTIRNSISFSGQTIALGGVLLFGGGSVGNNGGMISGTDSGVYISGGGSVANSGGMIIGTYRGVYISGGGSVTNSSGTISGTNLGVDISGAASVTNAGRIVATRTQGGAGVYFSNGGSISNSGSGVIASDGYGVLLANAAGTATNTGLVASYLTGGGAGLASLAGGSVTNGVGGIIDGEWIGLQFGVFPQGTVVPTEAPAGTLVNQGAISASDNKSDGAAVWIHGPGVVINQAGGTIQGATNGTIAGGPLKGFIDGGFGIVAYYQTTVINYGSIGSGTYSAASYQFGTKGPKQFAFDASSRNPTNTIANLIEMAPGASFGGLVKGSYGTGTAILELMTGSSTGTIKSFGSLTISGGYYEGYLGFGAVKLDNGARWSLGGTVASGTAIAFAGAGALTFANPTSVQGTITNFAAGDTIGLDGVTVTGSSYAGVVLTLDDTSGTIALNLPGSFATGDFVVHSLTSGADISLVQTQDRTLSWTGGGANSDFGTAANWDDITNLFDPAETPPGPTDTVEFNTTGGAVTGTGTVATLDVGTAGSGALQLSAGTTLDAGTLDAGIASTAVANIGVSGTGTELLVTGSATVADDGTGVMSILSGATFSGANLTVGNQGDSSGSLFVSGDGSMVLLSGALNIGTALGTGDLTVGPGASVVASVVDLQGDVVLEGGFLDPTVYIENSGSTTSGFGTVGADYLVLEGTIISNGTKLNKETEVVLGTVVGGGTLAITGGTTADGTAVNSPGILQIGTHDTIELTGAVLNAASTSFTDTQTPTGTYTVTNSVIDVVFQDASGVLLLDDIAGFGGTIATYHAGDSFVVTGGTLSGLGVNNGDTLTFSDSGSHADAGGIDQIIFGSGISAAGFQIVGGDTVQAVSCFTAGTRIQTEQGPVPVEHLTLGTRVVRQRGDATEIVWIGQRDIDCRHHPDPGTVCPVRVLAGAFGPGVPSRDLWLSPDHAVFVEGVLIPVHCLINGGTIRQMVVPTVSYYHVELPEHDVILAEGLPVESYLDTGNRANFSNNGGAVTLFADFSARMWEMAGCAPLVMTGPVLERVKRALARNEVVVPAPGHGVEPVTRPRAPWTRLNNRYTYY